MTMTGHVHDGKVILDAPAPLPDGTPVRVEPVPNGAAAPANGAAPLPPIINPINGKPYPSYIPREMAERMRRLDSGEEPIPEGPTWYERMKPLIEAAGDLGLPEDAALNHDHYLYGHPKKS